MAAMIGGQIVGGEGATRRAQVREAADELIKALDEMDKAIGLINERVQMVVVPTPQPPDAASNMKPVTVEARCELAQFLHARAETVSSMATGLRLLATRIEL
ncbi:MAG: hypothetical protein HMLKMBBP_01508 [Planctomycetes bacterium]|nr:hypothetical protein [Planctomycetota bacterium]